MPVGAPGDPVSVREATPGDAEALLEIYGPLVRTTVVSFELEPPSVEEFRGRIASATRSWAWLVAEAGGEIQGYAYGSSHRARAAYRWSVETSAYVREGHRGRGLGTCLYGELLPRLAALGYCNAYAGIALPNEGSQALHRRAGFEPVGVFRRVGRKFGSWHDVAWWQRPLRDAPPVG